MSYTEKYEIEHINKNLKSGILDLNYLGNYYEENYFLEKYNFLHIHTFSLNLCKHVSKSLIMGILQKLSPENKLKFEIGNNNFLSSYLNEFFRLCFIQKLQIENLHAWGLEFNEEALIELSNYIQTDFCSLKKLNIGDTKIQNFSFLMESLTIYGKLNELNLNFNILNDLKIAPIGNYLINTNTLTYVSFQQCYMTIIEQRILFDSLSKNNSIIELDIVSINLENISLMKNFIENNKTIKKIILSFNNIKKGWKTFVDSLKKNNTIEELILENMNINIQIVNLLFTSLLEQNSITSLNLNKNPFGVSTFQEEMILDLGKVLERKILKNLYLKPNEYSFSFQFQRFLIDTILYNNHSLELVKIISKNQYSYFFDNTFIAKLVHDKKKYIFEKSNFSELVLNEIFDYIPSISHELIQWYTNDY